jgi:glycosyltransferase involved in cell wall biosynthesis
VSAEVSICIPVYNGGPFIRETVRSVLDQTFTDFELVVLDNRSTDDTLQRLEEFDDPRMRVKQADDHVDAVSNFNRATAECRGELVKLVCADDTLAPDCVEVEVQALRDHPSATMVAARRDIVDEHGRQMLKGRGLAGMEGLVDGAEAIARCVRAGTNVIGDPATVLMRRSALEGLEGPWSHTWPYVVDLDLWFRLLHDGDLAAVPRTLSHFRVHRSGWSAALRSSQAKQARALFAREAERPGSRVTRGDRLLGGVRAQVLQYGRQALYAIPRPAPAAMNAET